MAISYVGGAVASSAGNTDVSVDLTALSGGSDSAPSPGDLVIFAFNIADADNADLDLVCNTTDFAEIADLLGNGTQDSNLGVFWKIMGATPDTAVVGEGSTGGTDTSILGVAMVFRGVDQATPFDVAATTATGTTGGLPDPPSIDHTGAAGVWTVVVGANAHAAGAGGVFTAPANYTTNFLTIGDVNDTADGIIGMGYRTDPADPENPGAFSDNVAATGWCAVTMALRPAPESTQYDQPVSGTLDFAGAYEKLTGAVRAGTLDLAGAARTAVSRALSGALGLAGEAARAAARALAAALDSSGALAASRLINQALEAALAASGELVSLPGKVFEAALASAGALPRAVSRAVAGGLSSAGDLARAAARDLAGSLATAGDAARRAARDLAGSLSSAGSVAAQIVFTALLTAAVSFAGAVSTLRGVVLEAALALAGAVTRRVEALRESALSLAGSAAARVARALTASLELGGGLARRAARALSGVLALTAAGGLGALKDVPELFVVALEATLSMAGSHWRRITRAVREAQWTLRGRGTKW